MDTAADTTGDATPPTARSILITGAATELGLVACRRFAATGATVTGLAPDEKLAARVRANGTTARALDLAETDRLAETIDAIRPDIVCHLAPQRANTLLHDGQKWRGFERSLPAETTSLLAALGRTAARSPAPRLVYAGYAFLYGEARDASEAAPLSAAALEPIFAAAAHAEEQVRAAGLSATVLRLGYLYGPEFKDLALYVNSFRVHRLYWSGPKSGLANFLHVEDAAQALTLVADGTAGDDVFNVVDGAPASFGSFIDYFATTYGFHRPGHLPTWSARLVRRFITPQHIRQTALVTTVDASAFRRRFRWAPRYADYRAGLAETVRIMQANGIGKRRG
jgi:nucleoside-diphosphate-sugar epimerase